MAQEIKIYRSNTTALTDGSSALAFGILAITSIGGVEKFYVGDSAGVAREIGGDSFAKLAGPTFTGTVSVPTNAPLSGGAVAASQAYVDAAVAAGTTPTTFDFKDGVRVAASTNVTLSAPGAAIDGVTLTSGDRFLAFGQTLPAANGIYVFNGAASAATRSTDADTSAEVTNGMTIANTQEGTYANSRFVLTTADPIVLGTTALSFTSQSNTGLTAGDGITFTGSVVSVNATAIAGTGLENDGSNNLRISAAAAGTGLTGGAGSALAVSADSTGGANLSRSVNVSANGVAIKVDGVSVIEGASNRLEVGTVDGGTF
jgi:hypothetical protein